MYILYGLSDLIRPDLKKIIDEMNKNNNINFEDEFFNIFREQEIKKKYTGKYN